MAIHMVKNVERQENLFIGEPFSTSMIQTPDKRTLTQKAANVQPPPGEEGVTEYASIPKRTLKVCYC